MSEVRFYNTVLTPGDIVTVAQSQPLKSDALTAHWDLTTGYGSKHYHERSLKVKSAELSEDGRQVFLEIPDISPTWCMEIRYEVQSADGKPIRGRIHNTIHKLNR